MNISSSSLSSLSSVYATNQTAATSAVSSTDDSDATSAASDVDGNSSHTRFSKMGSLMSQLQSLESSDPAKAKQVLTNISDQLSAKASASGNSDPHLQELADKFKQAAQTGDLSGLQPSGGGHHMHGAHGGHGAPPPSSSSSSSDPDGDGDNDSSSSSSDSTTAALSSLVSSASRTKAANYAQGSDPMAQVESIISNALSSTTAS